MWQIGRSGETSAAERKSKRELIGRVASMLTKMHFFYEERSKDKKRRWAKKATGMKIN